MENDSLLRIESLITNEDFKLLNKKMINRILIKVLILAILLLVAGITLLVLSYSNVLAHDFDFAGYIFAPLGFLLLIFCFLLSISLKKNIKDISSEMFVYDFYFDKINVYISSGKAETSNELFYDDIDKVLVNDRLVYILLKNNFSYLLLKDDKYPKFNEIISSKGISIKKL